MESRTMKKMLAIVLAMAMALTSTPISVFALPDGCTHTHNGDCGYVLGALCEHSHDEACGEDGVTCPHEHDDTCGYIQAEPCEHICDTDCGGLADSGDSATTLLVLGFSDFAGTATVSLGTPSAQLPLPKTLTATIDGEDAPADIPVDWADDDGYNSEVPGDYGFTAVPGEGYALAEGVDAPIFIVTVETDAAATTKITIAAFDELAEDVATQGYDPGEIEAEEDLNLPDTLTGEDADGEAVTISGVSWECTAIISDPDADPIAFNPDTINIYEFTAVLPEGYALAEGVSLPTITVIIRVGIMPLANAATLVDTIRNYGLEASVDENTVTVTGSKENATAQLELDIDANVTVKWQATLEGNLSSGLVVLTGDGAFEVEGGAIKNTTGNAISAGARNAVTVSGGVVENEGTTPVNATIYMTERSSAAITVSGSGEVRVKAAGDAIFTSGNVKVEGGTVSATTGRAISVTGLSSTVTVSGGVVENEATSTGSPTIYISVSSSNAVTVSGEGEVHARAAGNAISASGSVEVKDNATVSATTGWAIFAAGTNSTVTVSGGTVRATTGRAIYAYGASSTVTVSGTDAVVEATGADGDAILAYGDVKVEDGTVSATTGDAISAIGVTVSGADAVVKATGDNGDAISAVGDVKVEDGTVSATTGYAIYATGASSTVTVSGGTVSATRGRAISTTGTSSTVTVSGADAVVEATGDNGDAISTRGNVEVQGGTVSATTGSAIYASYSSSTVTVSGAHAVVEATENNGDAIFANGDVKVENGTVSATTGYAIRAPGASSTVTVSGGTVSATSDYTIRASGASSTVTVSGGTVRATTGFAIYASNASSTVTVSGGLVFAYGSDITGSSNVIYISQGFTGATDTGVVIAWNSPGSGSYAVRSTDDITLSPSGATAYWYTSGSDNGIQYKNGSNEGFIPLSVTVDKITLTESDLTIPNAVDTLGKTYDNTASAGVGAVTHANSASADSTTGGTLTVYYTGTGSTTYAKSTTAPTNAGSYAVTVEVSGGTEYNALIGNDAISLGSFTISKKELTITGATIAAKTYDGTTAATVSSVTFSGLQGGDSLTLGTDFTATGVFDSADAGSSKSVTVTVTLGSTAKALNYTISGTFDLTSQSISKATQADIGHVKLVLYNDASTQTVDIAALVASYKLAGDTLSYTVQSATGANSGIIQSPSESGGVLSFNITGGADGYTATIPVQISGFTNYNNITVNVNVTLVDKTPVTITGLTAAGGTYNGQGYRGVTGTAGSGAYTGTLEYSYTGTGITGSTTTQPIDAGDYVLTVSVPSGDPIYIGRQTYSFTIGKRDLTVRPKSESMTVGGSLPTFALEYSGIVSGETIVPNPAPSFSCSGDGSAVGSFNITWDNEAITAFADGTGKVANYNITKQATGTLTVAQQTYLVTVNGGTGGGQYAQGATVNITANAAPSGQVFDKWTTTSNGVTFASATSASTSFTMPSNAVTVTATYKSSGGNGDGGGSSYTPAPSTSITTDKQPNMPTAAKTGVTGTVKDNVLNAGVITEKMAKDAIAAAGSSTNGIAVAFSVTGSGSYASLTATFERKALDALKTAGVKYVQFGSTLIDLSLDTKSITEILNQTTGNITVSAMAQSKLSEAAKKLIGSRPVFDITIKDSKGVTVSNLKNGTVTIGIYYKPASWEKKGNLYGVFVDSSGKPQLLTNSSYDNGKVIIGRSSLSIYGVGYKTPAPAFTDTATHWAKEDIDFVASRELISGISQAVFSPNTNITRADFLMALGKLSGADVSGYKTSSFTDVANDSLAMPYIEWAVKNGIVQGVGNNKFAPASSITREQMAVMMQNYAKATGYTLPVSRQAIAFADNAKISTWAKDAVKVIQQAGVISGKPNNLFDPQGNATRAESSAILRRFVELVIDEGTARGWVQNDAGQWQYIDSNGKVKTGWLSTTAGNKYWFDDKGIMASGKWVQIGGKYYYFKTDGTLATSTTIDGYDVGPDGARKE